jgi:hypothetical protein
VGEGPPDEQEEGNTAGGGSDLHTVREGPPDEQEERRLARSSRLLDELGRAVSDPFNIVYLRGWGGRGMIRIGANGVGLGIEESSEMGYPLDIVRLRQLVGLEDKLTGLGGARCLQGGGGGERRAKSQQVRGKGWQGYSGRGPLCMCVPACASVLLSVFLFAYLSRCEQRLTFIGGGRMTPSPSSGAA